MFLKGTRKERVLDGENRRRHINRTGKTVIARILPRDSDRADRCLYGPERDGIRHGDLSRCLGLLRKENGTVSGQVIENCVGGRQS